MSTERLGIIDLGSNSSRLVIYEIYSDRAYQRVFEMKQNLQLAREMGTAKVISEEALARAIACSRLFSRAGALHAVTHWIPVATAAIRQASNQRFVLGTLEEQTGFRFQVLNEWEEAFYGYLGVVNTLSIKDALLFDIGGASTELMLMRDRELIHATSLPLGSLNLSESLSTLPEETRGDSAYQLLLGQFSAIPWLEEANGLPLVGLGGTARAVAKLHRAQALSRTERIHGYPVATAYVRETFTTMKHMSLEKKRKIKGLSKPRARILTTGLACMAALVEKTASTEMVVSRNGLREGLFYHHLLSSEERNRVACVLDHSIHNLQKLFHVNLPIATMVRNAALELFDTLAKPSQLGPDERQLLRVTAEIEGVGYYINTEKSNRHSAYITLNSHLYGLSHAQLQEVAHLLEGKGREAMRKLLLLIRLAKLLILQCGIDPDGLHCRFHEGRLEVGRVSGIQETVNASADADLSHDFQKGFNIDLVFVE